MKENLAPSGVTIQRRHRNSFAGIGALAVAVFLGGIGGGIAFPILPLLGVRLGLSGFFIGMILAANRITRLGMNPLTGHWIDRVGGKLPLTVGLIIEAAATAGFSLSLHTAIPGPLLLLGRAIWGVGSSLLIVGGMTLGLNATDESHRGRSTAAVRMAMSLGMPAGLLLGGIVAGLVSDEAAFYTSSAVALLGAGISWFFVPNGAVKKAENEERSAGLRGELRYIVGADRRIQTVWITNLFVFFSIQGVLLATLVLVVQHRHLTLGALGVQPTAGGLMALLILSSAAVTIRVGRALDRAPSRVAFTLPAAIASAAGFVLLAFSTGLIVAGLSLVLIGVGMGGISVPLLTLLGDLTPEGRRGHTVGIYQLFGDVGGSLGPVVGVQLAGELSFRAVYAGVAVLLLLVALLLLTLRRDGADVPSTTLPQKEPRR